MSDLKRSLWPVVTAVFAIGAFVGGNEARTRQEMGASVRASSSFDVASIELSTNQAQRIPEGEYFYQLTQLLEREYVEPITDERKLAYGAVKGMISGLWDPYSQYFTPDQMVEFRQRQKGIIGGAGVEVTLVFDEKELLKVRRNAHSADPLMLFPELQVTMVAPGSPADSIGLQVGDRLMGVNGKSLVGFSDIRKVREAQQAVVQKTLAPEEFNKVRANFQKRVKTVIGASRAMDLIMTGEGKILNLEWRRGAADMNGTLTTRSFTVPAAQKAADGTIQLRLWTGASTELEKLLDQSSPVVLDLRQSGMGDANEIAPVLERLAPAGTFGKIVKHKGGTQTTLTTSHGVTRSPSMRLIVDGSTRGAAEILALALKSRGLVTVEGSSSGQPVWVTVTSLDDGSGYVLNTGKFVPDAVEARK